VVVLRFIVLTLLISSCFGQSPQNIVVTSAASSQAGLPPKGSIGSIRCTGLQIHGTVAMQSVPVLTLAGVSVTVGGAPTPIFAVADMDGSQLIYFEVPQEAVFNTDTTATVVVTQNGSQGSARVPISTSPGDFFLIGNQLGAFQHASDFSVVTEQNPAHPGEVLVGYLTGTRTDDPLVPTGTPAPLSPLAVVPEALTPALVDQFALLVGGTLIANSCSPSEFTCTPSNILFLGLTPKLVGVYQINFVLPASVSTGDTRIQLQRYTCGALAGAFGSCGGPVFSLDPTVGCRTLAGLPPSSICTGSPALLPIR
jgi:uncharacterized protein (TIGR03437 family)